MAVALKSGTARKLGLRPAHNKKRAAAEAAEAAWRHAMTQSIDDTARSMGIVHADDHTWWYDAPLPKRWHRCSAWTSMPGKAERCACGGLRHAGDLYWSERNSRRKDAR